MNENKTEIRNLVRLIKRARRQKDFYDTDYHTGIGIGSSVPVSYVNEKYCSPIRQLMSLARCRSKILNTATDLRKPTIDHSLTRVEDCWEQGKYTYIRTIHTYKRRRILQQRIDEQLDGLLEKAR